MINHAHVPYMIDEVFLYSIPIYVACEFRLSTFTKGQVLSSFGFSFLLGDAITWPEMQKLHPKLCARRKVAV